MKKLILGLLSAAIIILSFTACQQSSTPATTPVVPVVTNAAPVIDKAIFLNADDVTSSLTWGQAQEKAVTTLEKSKDYKIAVYWTDADANSNQLQLCKNSSFDRYWRWTFTLNNPAAQATGNWVTWNLNLSSNSEARSYFTNQSNKPLYVKMLDASNNESATYIISGITITN